MSNEHKLNVPIKKLDEFAIALLPRIRAFFQSEEGQREYAEWKKEQQAKEKKEKKVN